MENKKTAIVVGATGLIGGFVVEHLIHHDEYSKIVVLGRKDIEFSHPKIEVYISDFSDLEKFSFWAEADSLFCCLGTTIGKAGSQENFRKVDYHIPVALGNMCESFGIQYLLVSSVGADANSSNFYLRTKGETEKALINCGIKCLHIFRPSMLLGPRKESRLGEQIGKVFMKIFDPVMIGGLKKYKAIQAETVAKSMIKHSLDGRGGVFIHENDEIIKEFA